MKAKPFFDEIDPKYTKLVEVYRMAYDRAASGKGHAHHARGEPFEQQWILRGTRMFGLGGPQFQIGKKNEQIAKTLDVMAEGIDRTESLNKQAAIKEFLDIINYAAAGVIYLQEQQS